MRPAILLLTLFLPAIVFGQRPVLYHNDYWPSWSPDGKRIVFTSSRAEIPYDVRSDELYIVDVRSGKEVQLTDNNISDNTPHWSSDGSLISFISSRDGKPDVYLMNSDGSNVRQITKGGLAFNGSTNAISVRRSKIYFQSQLSGRTNIYEVGIDGSGVNELFSGGEYDNHTFRLSRGENELIYASNRTGSDRLYTYNFDTGEEEEIPIDSAYRPYYPSISNDGRWVSFISFRDERGGDIYRANRDGSKVTRLTTSVDWDYDPAISPDNQRIAFNSRRDGKRGIYLMNADGSIQRKITSKIHGNELIQVIRSKGLDFGLEYYQRMREKWVGETYFSGLAMYELAQEFVKEGRDTEAIQLLRLSLDDPFGRWQVLNLKKLIELDSSASTWQLISEMGERIVNKVGYDLMSEKNFEAAIKVFSINVNNHPESANCWDSLGDGYLNSSRVDQARESFERALRLSPPEPMKKSIQSKLEKLGDGQ